MSSAAVRRAQKFERWRKTKGQRFPREDDARPPQPRPYETDAKGLIVGVVTMLAIALIAATGIAFLFSSTGLVQ